MAHDLIVYMLYCGCRHTVVSAHVAFPNSFLLVVGITRFSLSRLGVCNAARVHVRVLSSVPPGLTYTCEQ